MGRGGPTGVGRCEGPVSHGLAERMHVICVGMKSRIAGKSPDTLCCLHGIAMCLRID